MKMKKKISLVLALLMSVTIAATGCKKTNEDTSGISDAPVTAPPITQMTTAAPETTTTAPVVTTTTAAAATEETSIESETENETETQTETETEISSETATETSETTVPLAEPAEEETTTAKRDWNETEINETMYTTQACYSRKVPVIGAETVAQYNKNTKVNVVAATDTGYYKLADGSFIHADYLTDAKPVTTTKKPVSDPDIIEDPDAGNEPDITVDIGTGSSGGGAVSTSHKKDYTTRYAYKTLTADQKVLYQRIVTAAENLTTRVTVPDNLYSDDIAKVYGMVFNQEPQLFWLSRSIPSGYGEINLEYVYTREQIASMQKEIDKNVNSILATANKYTGSNVSKIKVFYDWIITHNNFSKSDSAATCGIYNGLTPGGDLQCAGYAKSMLYLCDLAGIDCMTIVGTNPEGASHAWNIVYCDNGWYNIDATWGDATASYAKEDFLRYTFFLVPDEWIKDSHINVNILTRGNGNQIKYFDPPACTKTSCNYFKAYNKEYTGVDAAYEGMLKEIEATAKAKKNVAHIRVTDKKTWDTLVSSDYAKKFYKHAVKCGAKDITVADKLYADGVLVVQYNLKY